MDTTGAEGIDLTGVDGRHPQTPPPLQRRIAVAGTCFWGAMAVLQVVAGDGVLAALYAAGAVLQVLAVVWLVRRPQATLVGPEGVSRRYGHARRTVPWAEVDAVLVQGRWAETSRLRLRDGRLLALPGMSPEQAQRLASALAAVRRP